MQNGHAVYTLDGKIFHDRNKILYEVDSLKKEKEKKKNP